jgi:hypothetical protein
LETQLQRSPLWPLQEQQSGFDARGDPDAYRFPLAMFVLEDPRSLRADRLH